MSTGALAVVLGNTPNKFPGLQTIGAIVYILDIVLFLLFTSLMVMRFILVPRKLTASLHHPVEGLFHGTFWVSLALILNGAYVYGNDKTGPWLTKALEVCFWLYCAASFSVSIAQYSMFFRLERLTVTDAVPAWIFPIYPLLVVGTLAGTILPAQPDSASLKIFIGGVLFQGLAWLISFLMYGIYMQRLMTSSLPSAQVRPGMFVSVGPAGTICCNHVLSDALTVCRVHCGRHIFPCDSSSTTYTAELLDGYCGPRWRDCPHHRHHGWSIHSPIRILVLLHHDRRRSSRHSQNVLLAELVGLYLPECRPYPGHDPSWECPQE
jgi:C4-dicarboxylate transporter/malic acid transport protein